MFPFDMFNAVQSKALDDVSHNRLFFNAAHEQVYNSSQNIVLAAPTSAGKTIIFELALLRMIKEWEFYPEKRLAIYIAPTKVGQRTGSACLTIGALLRTLLGLVQ